MEGFYAVIVAAGSSRRAGFDKLTALLCGKPVLCRSIEAFAAAGAAGIAVVCPPERRAQLDLREEALPCPLYWTAGGAERQDSVEAGLAALPKECRWVAVHDGARPLVRPQDIVCCLEAARIHGAATCAHPVVDTLKRADANGMTLREAVSREGLWGMETPQIFDVALLRRAYEEVRRNKSAVTDEVSAVEAIGQRVALVRGGVNLKITLPGDLETAEAIWRNEHR